MAKKPPQVKIQRVPVHGVILLNKPLHISSNAALQKVRWLLKAQKGGHTGALDPLATGLLPLCFGEATKLSHFGLEAEKTYQARIQLGAQTTTGDKEGEVLTTASVPELSVSMITAALAQFKGDTTQVPPMYSALKKDGRPLYELARAGITIDRPARAVHISDIQLVAIGEDWIDIQVTCSKGTYIRVLGEDIAVALGSVGHLSALHRVQSANLVLDASITLEYIEALPLQQRYQLLLPCEVLAEGAAQCTLSEAHITLFKQGQVICLDNSYNNDTYVVFSADQQMLGLALVKDNMLYPKKVFNL